MCGVPSETTWRTSAVHSPPIWQALRATRPPIEWPTSARRSISTGQVATNSSSSAASAAPFCEMWRPLLKRMNTGVMPEVRLEPVAVGRAAPGELGLAQAVEEDGDVRPRGLATPAHVHRERERAALGFQPVAVEAVERGDRGRAAGRVRQRRVAGPRDRGRAGGGRGQPQAAADALVDTARDRDVGQPERLRGRAQRAEHAARDRAVDRADPARQRRQLIGGEAAERARLGLGLRRRHPSKSYPKRWTTEPVATSRPSGSVTLTSLNTMLRPRRTTTAVAVRSWPRAAAV